MVCVCVRLEPAANGRISPFFDNFGSRHTCFLIFSLSDVRPGRGVYMYFGVFAPGDCGDCGVYFERSRSERNERMSFVIVNVVLVHRLTRLNFVLIESKVASRWKKSRLRLLFHCL